LFVAAVGVALTLSNFDYIDMHAAWRWWPVVIIAGGLAKAAQSSAASGRGIGLLFAFFGTLMLLDSLRILEFDWWKLWPIQLVVLGGALIWGAMTRNQRRPAALDSKSEVHAMAVLGSSVRGTNSQDFRGGEATAVFGSCEIDLRQASIGSNEVVFDCLAVWAGIEIKIPPDWTVIIQAAPILGSIEDKTMRPAVSNKHLVLRGLAFMGSVEILN
jgi:predicted membrane protein